jgi:hypothetical protein
MTNKPDETTARAYAAVLGVDWSSIKDWYVENGSLTFVTVKDSPSRNKGWAA